MPLTVSETTVKNVLTRCTGYLKSVTSHSLQPYRGCSYGNSLCGVGCYVQHNGHVTQGRPWGSFLEVRTNAADSYLAHAGRERRWARQHRDGFSIFCSSSTDPFLPQESRYHITAKILTAMLTEPPDRLILQTHSHLVAGAGDQLVALSALCDVKVHVSIESDRDTLPGLPPPASSVKHRTAACRQLRKAGLFTVVTVAPLLPMADPERFFAHLATVADAVVIDHFIQGDGSADGRRTRRTPLPEAMFAVDAASTTLDYRDRIVAIARRHFPGRVGVNIDGFAGRYLVSLPSTIVLGAPRSQTL